MQSGANKKIDVPRLQADLAAAAVELLSAHCATDRVRLRYSPEDIVAHADPATLKKAIHFAGTLHDFFSKVDHHIKVAEKAKR